MENKENLQRIGRIILENQQYFKTGLCGWVSNLTYSKILTEAEEALVKSIINRNRPSFSFINDFYNPDKINKRNNGFYWNEGYIKPRIKWIKKHFYLN